MNEVICHGIPDTRELEDGDICNGKNLYHSTMQCSRFIEYWWSSSPELLMYGSIAGKGEFHELTKYILPAVDITVYHGGFHGDLNETFFVGKVDDDSRKLVQTAYECMMKGVAIGEYRNITKKDISMILHSSLTILTLSSRINKYFAGEQHCLSLLFF